MLTRTALMGLILQFLLLPAAAANPRLMVGPGQEEALRARLGREPYRSLYRTVKGWADRGYDPDDHSIGSEQRKGNIAKAAAFVECAIGGRVLWGVGIDPSIVTASLKAIISAVNRAQRDEVG